LKTRPWPVLAALHRQIEGGARIDPALYDALADRIEAALAAETADDLRLAAESLQTAYHSMLRNAPTEVRQALRDASGADSRLQTAFWAGQTAFAQLLSARALDKRADDRFVSRLTDPRYERYVRALFAGAQTGEQLAAQTGERKETVSRKLGALAGLGVIERRRQGSHVVNVLAPAAREYLRQHRIAPWSAPSAKALNALRREAADLDPYLQSSVIIGDASRKVRAA
jgi:DNA-binding transcriptional ArsR family regulator